MVLRDLYPAPASIACNPESTIADNREGNIWSITFRRNLQDWEGEDFLNLFGWLEGHNIAESQPDRISWGSSMQRHIHSYKHLCSQNEIIENWPCKLIWRNRLPTQVICFTWTALNGACLTQDNLAEGAFSWLIEGTCGRGTWSPLTNLLIYCPVAAELWNFFFFSIFGLSWMQPQSIKDAYESWRLCRVDKAIKKI